MTSPGVSRRKALRQRIAAVREVLLELWDPLGVGGNPHLADEYDSYLGKVLAAIDNGPDAVRLALTAAEADLGIGSQRGAEVRQALVERLMDLKS